MSEKAPQEKLSGNTAKQDSRSPSLKEGSSWFNSKELLMSPKMSNAKIREWEDSSCPQASRTK